MKERKTYKAEVIGGKHGLTCIFPKLQDVINYKENDRVPVQGYPRFIPHPFVVSVQERYEKDDFKVIAIQTSEAASIVHANYFDEQTRKHSYIEVCDDGLVFLEIPTNPLLKIEDLTSIVQQAHSKGAVVIVDSTIASPFHFSPFDFGVDIIIHSTSKSLSGKNNHMGGVLFVNPRIPKLAENILHLPFELDEDEQNALSENLLNFSERIKKMAENAEAFYNNCTIPIKGPSMGFKRTMLMPYTLITHYHDSNEDLAEMGLKRYLMRLSIGTENPDEIIQDLASGFNAVSNLNNTIHAKI